MAELSVLTPIEYLKGVGPARADLLKQELGVFTFGDLLRHYPFRYIDRTHFHRIAEIRPEMEAAQVIGRLIHLEEIGERRSRRLVGQFVDDTGQVELVWFQSIAWLKKPYGRGGLCYVWEAVTIQRPIVHYPSGNGAIYPCNLNEYGRIYGFIGKRQLATSI